jgi:hypothetical protein
MSYYGGMPTLISIPIEPKINGINGGVFLESPGIAHRYEYYNSVGDVYDDISGETITNCVQVYNYLHNEWGDYSFYKKPTCWLSFIDNNGIPQLVFASDDGFTYKMGGNSDYDGNSTTTHPINSEIQGVLNFGVPDMDKKFSFMRVHFNPGCGVRMQVAITDTFNTDSKKWIDLGDLHTGFKKFAFPEGSRGKLLFYKITDSNSVSAFRFYGMCIDWEEQGF